MKKIVLLVAIVILSCGTSKTVRTSKKVIKGDWILNAITYDQTGTSSMYLPFLETYQKLVLKAVLGNSFLIITQESIALISQVAMQAKGRLFSRFKRSMK